VSFCFLSLFLYYAFVISGYAPEDRLTGDEIFYYFQAQHLRDGEFVWFADTQPYLYPLFLALTFFDDVTALRMANAAVMALAAVFTGLLGARIAGRAGFWGAFLLFGLHPRTLQLGTSLFVESLFMLLQAAVFLAYDAWQGKEKPAWLSSLGLGILLGLTLECRPVGFLLLPPLALEATLRHGRKAIPHLFLMFSVAVLFILPYGVFHAHIFLGEKIGETSGRVLLRLWALLHEAPGYLGLPVLVLLLGGAAWRLRIYRRPLVRFLFLYGILFFTVIVLFDRYIFLRHLYPLIMPLACLTVAPLPFLSARHRTLFMGCILGVACWEVGAGLKLQPVVYSNNYLFVSDPETALDVRDFEVIEGPEAGRNVSLPYFSQPNDSRVAYRAVVDTRHGYEAVVVSYAADYVKVRVNGVVVQPGHEGSPFKPLVIQVPLPAGRHVFDVEIRNEDNIGGMGQVLLATKDFVDASVRRAPSRQPWTALDRLR